MKISIRFVLFLALLFGAGLIAGRSVHAEDAPAQEPNGRVDEFEQIEEGDDSANKEAEEEPEPEVKPEQKLSKGGTRAKEAEGSKAPNRFQADVVTKSNYKLNGDTLEVDPD